MHDKTLRLAALIRVEDGSEEEAKEILDDILQVVRDRLEYWGVGLETHSPYTLMGEIT